MRGRNANVQQKKYLEAVFPRPKECRAGISNRRQVMRQQNRISSILPNTGTCLCLCGDLEEIFWPNGQKPEAECVC